MKIRKIILSAVSIMLITLLLISTVTVGAVTFKSIKKNDNFHYGVDVSTFNKKLDFAQLKKEGVEFMFIRLGYYKDDGGHLDVRFEENIKGAVENGIEFGVYVYSYIYKADDLNDCAKWINEELEAMGNYCKDKDTIQVAYDIEDQVQKDAISNKKISKSTLNKNIKTFCTKIKKFGYIPVVYSFLSYFKNYLDLNGFQKNGIKIWYAQWPYTSSLNTTVKKRMYNNTYADIWQFSDSLTVNGKVTDTNVCYTDFYDYSKEDSTLKTKKLKKTYEYTGSAIKPEFEVYDGDTLLNKNTDYKVYYFKNKKLGRATMKIVRFDADGNYLETKTFRFIIKAPKVNLSVSANDKKAYMSWKQSYGATKYAVYKKNSDGEYKKLGNTLSTSYEVKNLKPGKSYTYSVRAYSEVRGNGYYSEYSDAQFYTKYKKIKIKSVKSKSEKTATVKWMPKTSGAKGYQIQYGKTRNFTNGDKITLEGKSVKKAVIENLKSGKMYYFRVRSYNIKNENKIYSVYSDTLNTKIK